MTPPLFLLDPTDPTSFALLPLGEHATLPQREQSKAVREDDRFRGDVWAVSGRRIELRGDEGRHAATVKRIVAGELVLLGDGQGTVAECRVVAASKDSLTLDVISSCVTPPPTTNLVLVQALPKGERAELAIELATELGVDEIVPWAAARCVVRWDGPRGERALQRWRRTAREAGKQSRRPWLPDVAPLASTADVTARLAGTTGFVLHEDATEPLADTRLPGAREILLVVGPEGGITAAELDAFATAGATAVRLGEPVLRTSTAGAAAIAALSVRLGRWS